MVSASSERRLTTPFSTRCFVFASVSTAAFHEALRTNNADAFMSYVADDVVLMPPGEPAVRGKEGVRLWYAGLLSQYRTSSLTLADREVFVGDDWAVELGTFQWGAHIRRRRIPSHRSWELHAGPEAAAGRAMAVRARGLEQHGARRSAVGEVTQTLPLLFSTGRQCRLANVAQDRKLSDEAPVFRDEAREFGL